MKLTPARALLLYAMFCYESMGENTSLFVANKLAYLMQRLGESSFKRLQFKASHYGPYNVQVDHLVLKGLEQMKLTAFEPIGLRYDKISEVGRYIKKELDSKQIDRLKRLITLIKSICLKKGISQLRTIIWSNMLLNSDFTLRPYSTNHHLLILPFTTKNGAFGRFFGRIFNTNC